MSNRPHSGIRPPRTSIAVTIVVALVTVLLGLILVGLLPGTSDAGWRNWMSKGHRIEGSGVLATKIYELDGFDGVRVEGVADVAIRIGDEFRVELEAEDNLIELVDVYVRRGTLVIAFEDDADEIDTDEGFEFQIVMPSLRELRVDGVGTIEARGLDSEELTIRVDGVGNLDLEGRTRRLDVEMDGVGDVELRDLVAQEARVRVDGVGEVTLYVEDRLDVAVDGMGTVRYYGDPDVVRDRVDGFGRIVSR